MRTLWRRSRPLVRAGTVLGALVALAVVGGSVYWFGLRDAAAATTTTASPTRTVAASLTTMEKTVTTSGTVTPTVQETVSFAVSGTVTSVPVSVGQQVSAGQVLATVDPLALEADLLAARATLAAAQARWSDDVDADDGSDADAAQIASDAAQVEVAQAAVGTAEAATAAATLVAPVAGLLTTVDVAVGDVVTGSGGSGSGTSGSGGSAGGSTQSSTATAGTTASGSFVVVGTDAWQVDVTVGETDIALVAVGQQAEITVEGVTDVAFGTVREVGLLSSSTSGVAAYPVVVDVTGTPQGLHDGVAVDVDIVHERRTDVLSVPSAAVSVVDGQSVVTQPGADGDVTTPVEVGETSGGTTEILSGLAEGDEVLVATFQPRATQDGADTGTTEQRFPGGDLPQGFAPSGTMPGGTGPGRTDG